MAHIYREDGGKFRVEVLSDTTDDDGMRAVVMRCIETLRPSPIFGSIKRGGVWESTVRLGYEGMVGWTLEPEATP